MALPIGLEVRLVGECLRLDLLDRIGEAIVRTADCITRVAIDKEELCRFVFELPNYADLIRCPICLDHRHMVCSMVLPSVCSKLSFSPLNNTLPIAA